MNTKNNKFISNYNYFRSSYSYYGESEVNNAAKKKKVRDT